MIYGKGGNGKSYVGISKTPEPVEWIDVDHRSDTHEEDITKCPNCKGTDFRYMTMKRFKEYEGKKIRK